MNSYLPCLRKIALGEFTRNQYKNLAVGTRSRWAMKWNLVTVRLTMCHLKLF